MPLRGCLYYVEGVFNLVNYTLFHIYSNYVIMVTMFFTVSVINNYALNFNIAMPLHMIFRSVSSVSFISFLLAAKRLCDQRVPLLVHYIS